MKFSRDLLISLLAVCLALAAVEGGLRLAQVRFNASLYRSVPRLGFGLRPGAEGWNVDENEAYVRINRAGWRDRERTLARPADTLRIAVVGSCEVDARQVAMERTFETVIQRETEKRAANHARHVEVLNFGVPGYTFSQNYLSLIDAAFAYDPQVVILVLQPFNYLRNTRELYPGDTLGTPFYRLENGKLVEDEMTRTAVPPDPRNVARHARFADAMNMSYTLSLANSARLQLQRLLGQCRAKLHIGETAKPAPVHVGFEELRYTPDHPDALKSWAIGDAFVELMKAECERRGIEFRIVTVDDNAATHPDPAMREAFRHRMNVPVIDAAERKIAQFCERRGIPLLLPGAAVLAYAEAHHTFLHGNVKLGDNMGFWNAEGHEVIGQLISNDLLQGSAKVREFVQR